jgi:hypothetical protein
MNEKKLIFDEARFTHFCKLGFIQYPGESGTVNINLTRLDIKKLFEEETITKKFLQEEITIILFNISKDLFKEIVKRSPLYSDLYYEL